MIALSAELLHRIASTAGIDSTALTHLGGGREDSDGIAYTYPHPAGERVLKILAFPRSDTNGLLRLEERIKFARFLGQHGVDIVYPLEQPGGSLVSTLSEGDFTYPFYLMDKASGEHPKPDAWFPDFCQRWGSVVGRLHRVTQDYPSWEHSLDSAGQPLLGWREEWQGFYEWCADLEVKQAWDALRLRLEQLPRTRDSFGFVHNDPHIQNILYDGQRIVLLDFDVANYHWFASDIAIACQAVLFARSGGMDRPLSDRAALLAFLQDFKLGYEKENHLDLFWWHQVDLFIQYRRILLFTVMQGWLETVPETRQSWKDMILRQPPLLEDW